jgi:hypothetical protein
MKSPSDDLPWSEQFQIAGEDWAEKEAAASLLEDCKSAVMAQRQAMLGDMAVNKAEQVVKASPDWTEYIEQTIEARKAANKAKVNMEAMRMKFNEWQNTEANARTEARLVS